MRCLFFRCFIFIKSCHGKKSANLSVVLSVWQTDRQKKKKVFSNRQDGGDAKKKGRERWAKRRWWRRAIKTITIYIIYIVWHGCSEPSVGITQLIITATHNTRSRREPEKRSYKSKPAPARASRARPHLFLAAGRGLFDLTFILFIIVVQFAICFSVLPARMAFSSSPPEPLGWYHKKKKFATCRQTPFVLFNVISIWFIHVVVYARSIGLSTG